MSQAIACPQVQTKGGALCTPVVVKVSVTDAPVATEFLRQTVVPGVSQAPGFVAGYWVRLEGGDEGNSV